MILIIAPPHSSKAARHASAVSVAAVQTQTADLSVAGITALSQVLVNSTLTYTINVTNFGPDTANAVTVSDALPAGLSFISCQSTAGGVCGGTANNRTVNFTSLAPGAFAVITLMATVDCTAADTSVISNTASISSATNDSNNANNSATAETVVSNPVWIYPASQSFAANGGAGSVSVNRPSGCALSAISNVPWITVNNVGANTVSYTVASNTSASVRSGTINIAGRNLTVLQGVPFNDVPETHPFYTFISKLSARGITLGCGGGNYCPGLAVTRDQMAAFIIRALGDFNPPAPASQRFNDVEPSNIFYSFIDEMAVKQITLGCSTNPPLYCPSLNVTREQMAAFIIRSLHAPGYQPPPPSTQRFNDVAPSNIFYSFIDEMAVRQITLGCSTSPPLYCPLLNVTRDQMAAFLIRAFDNPNLPPSVSAGSDQSIKLPTNSLTLNGAVADDGLPSGGSLTVVWSKLSGPGTVSFNNPNAAMTQATFGAAGVYVLRLTAGDSEQTASDDVTITVTAPPTVNAGPDQVVMLPNTGMLSGTITGGTGTVDVAWSQQSGPGTVLFGSASATATSVIFPVEGVYILRLTGQDANSVVSDEVQVTVNPAPPPPPDPATVAPSPDQSVVTTIGAATEFLYTGANPIQTGVAAGTIKAERAAVLRGRVLKKDNSPLSNVKISVLDHPEFGQTLSRADGRFDLAVNGGGVLVVKYEKTGFLPVQRSEDVPWQDYRVLADVVMIGYDLNVTLIDLNLNAPVQVAQGGVMNDDSGARRARLFFLQGTTALMKLPGGAMQSLNKLHVRATEYTVGANGPNAMPGDLPPNSGYTYAAEYSLDEAVAANATDVLFNQPVISYEENFLGFPAGLSVPTGYYDRALGRWIPSASGRVVKILSIANSQANLDLDGSNTAASNAAYAALGITNAERQQLAALYASGQSLWRTPLTHFSPWDKNWGFGPPANAKPPKMPRPNNPGRGPDGPACQPGSIIRCEYQTLGESVEVTGTPFSLNYESGRVPGRKAAYTLTIALSDSSVPASLKRIELEVAVAGRLFTQSFSNAANQTTTFTWDGIDAYGRTLQGGQQVGVRIGYVYDGVYGVTNQFGYYGNGQEITGSETRREVTLWQQSIATVGVWDARGSGLGAWTLSVHHTYDPNAQILYLGTGDQRSIKGTPPVVSTVAGGVATDCVVHPQLCQDGQPATTEDIHGVRQIAVDAQGTLYLISNEGSDSTLRKVTPDGLIYKVLGGLNLAEGVAVDGQGNIYVSDSANFRILKNGSLFAGTGAQADNCIDPQNPCPPTPATSTSLCGPGELALDQSGNLYFRDCARIKKIDPAGNLSTVVYLGAAPAPDTQGNLYYTDMFGTRVMKLSPDGKTTVIAGGNGTGTTGDSGLATQATIECTNNLFVDRADNLYISQGCNTGLDRVRVVTPDGIINTSGGGPNTVFGDNTTPLRLSGFRALRNIIEDGLGNLYVADNGAGNPGRIYKVTPPLPRFSATEILIASEDGREVYVFNLYGRHLRTQHALTGAILYQFTYDSAGRLAQVTDGDNNITTVQRNGAGNPTAIVGPFSQSTTLTLDPKGFLASITDPASQAYQFSYSTNGLMASETDPRSSVYSFMYDPLGRLTKDTDPATGFKMLARTDQSLTSYSIALTTALNRTDTYQVQTLINGDQKRIYTDPAGLQTQFVEGLDGRNVTTVPDGTVTTIQLGGDPRWKLQAPLDKSTTITTPGMLSYGSTFARTATLSNPNNLFSLTAQNDTLMVNGRTYTNNYAASTKTFTFTTPVARQVITTIDTQGRTTLNQFANLNAFNFTYDSRGRLATATGGAGAEARTTTFTYNAGGFLASITDPLSRVTSLTYDLAGRVTQRTLPGNRVIAYGYDANGNLTLITPPGRPAHVFAFTPVDLGSNYTPPTVPGTGQTTYAYNLDRQLTSITRPDSQALTFGYDTGGRLSTLTIPGGQYGYTYHPTTGNLSNLTAPGSISLSFTYDGSLLTQTSWAGAVAGSVGYTYDNDFRLASQNVNGANPISFTYDEDSLLTGAGALTLTRNAQTGLVTGATLGSVTESFTYNGFAEATVRSGAFNGMGFYSAQYAYDKLGRITQKIETVQGVADTFDYTYHPAGRLMGVTVNGAPTPANTYTYDLNGNRTSASIGGFVSNGTYDNQDRLTQYGNATYIYTANGELQSKTVGAQTTQYSYDVMGNLKAVTLPSSTQIDYLIDGLNRRVGKKVGGTLVQGFLYEGQLSPVAELNGANNVLSRFVYARHANVPDYMIKGGVTYRIITDHLGSVRIVVDVATGSVAQRIDYDEFGVVLVDTNPGFQPFGFAGGLYDKDTGLVRFGARDYDAQTGRWTAKDPIMFAGGDTNLYGYVLNDPINFRDINGLFTGGIGGILENDVGGASGASGAGGFSDVVGASGSFGSVSGILGPNVGSHGNKGSRGDEGNRSKGEGEGGFSDVVGASGSFGSVSGILGPNVGGRGRGKGGDGGGRGQGGGQGGGGKGKEKKKGGICLAGGGGKDKGGKKK
jgi:RHS repeat-associated protein/uncharacterized repeat protein (TIGR01451 family)